MAPELLEQLIADTINAQPGDSVEFVWHGGEPTLLGVEYFSQIVRLQQQYAQGKEIRNLLQTNGTLIDDRWAEFLAENHFLCGLSIDGPEALHNAYRRYPNGKGSWANAVRAAHLFVKHGVEFNTMTAVNDRNAQEPQTVYQFLKSIGSHYMQFLPVVEHLEQPTGAPPYVAETACAASTVAMPENVSPQHWGEFLCAIFDMWVRRDVGSYFVNFFDNTLAAYLDYPPTLCSMNAYCSCSPVVEHNGDLYSCDHFVFPNYKLGNIRTRNVAEWVKTYQQLQFEESKRNSLSAVCRSCSYLSLCGGDCPANRIAETDAGEKISHLCAGFRHFFSYTQKEFQFMAEELRQHRAPANIMNQNLPL